jgi:hypothetical protein
MPVIRTHHLTREDVWNDVYKMLNDAGVFDTRVHDPGATLLLSGPLAHLREISPSIPAIKLIGRAVINAYRLGQQNTVTRTIDDPEEPQTDDQHERAEPYPCC